MRKWENKKKIALFFALFFQHRPYFDIVPGIGIIATLPNKNGPLVDIVREVRHNYPKKSRKKNTSHPAEPAPDPAPPRRFLQCGRATQISPKSTAGTPPKIHPKTPPKSTPETVPKSPPKTPRPNPSRNRADNRTPPPQNLPRVLLGPGWVNPGSELGPHLILWKVYHIPLHFPKHRDTFQPNRNPP